MTHFQCSLYIWSRNQGNVTSNHAADSVTFAERVGNSKSRPWSMIHRNCDLSVLRHTVALHLHQQVCQNIEDTTVRTSRFTLLKNLSCLRLITPAAKSLVGYDSSSHEELFGISRSRLRRSSMSSSAVMLHCAFFCRIFCRTASDFLEACFVKQSAISYLASIHLKSSFAGHCLGLDYGQLNCQSLVCRRWSCSFPVYCIVKAFAVGDKNAGTSREELLISLEHKFTAGHLFPHCAHPIEMFLASRRTACLCSQTAADNPLDLLALPAQYRHKYTTIRNTYMYCKDQMALL